MWGWACGVAALVLVPLLAWVFSRHTVYRRVFSDEHLLEVGRGIARLKAAAFDYSIAGEPGMRSPQDDPGVLVSGAGLVLAYTVHPVDGGFVHHWSVSLGGGYTAHAVGEMFILFTAKLMGIEPERLALGIGRSTVHHAELALSEAEHEPLGRRVVPDLSADDMAAFRKEYLAVADRLRWEQEP